jgi:hypothetical protein
MPTIDAQRMQKQEFGGFPQPFGILVNFWSILNAPTAGLHVTMVH